MSEKRVFFIDEFGNVDIETDSQGSTTYFILTAVVVRPSDLGAAVLGADEVRRKHFQTGPMKSKGIGPKAGRRVRVLRDICSLPIKTFSMAVDKRAIYKGSGLAYHQPFFKFMHRKLHERLFRAFPTADVVADEHGSREFMDGFKTYLEHNIPNDLFFKRDFRFAKDEAEPLLQVADIVSGSLGYCLDPKKVSADQAETTEVLRLLTSKSIGIDFWPPKRMPRPVEQLELDPDLRLDEVVRSHCVGFARDYLLNASGAKDPDEDDRIRIEVLEYLLFQAEYVDDQAFVQTQQILDHLHENVGMPDMSVYRLRSAGIGPLRDDSVIIASGPKGYKIPVCVDDLMKFVNHANTIIPRMLDRLRKARDELVTASEGDLDIVGADNVQYLRELVEVPLK